MSVVSQIGLKHEEGNGPTRASSTALDRFERRYKVKLPASYRAMLMEVNGGTPTAWRVIRNRRAISGINAFFFLGRAHDDVSVDRDWDYENLHDETAIAQQTLKMGLVPFANDGAGSLFAFVPPKMSVVLVDSADATNLTQIADDFDALIGMMSKK